MSIVAFKKKSVIQYGSNRSAKPSDGKYWVTQGPFGASSINMDQGAVGFSLNGGRRNSSYVGKTYHMSKNGTSFRGVYPLGGVVSDNSQIVYNVTDNNILGDQYEYIKPSSLSYKGMLRNKHRWINSQYPNYWVKSIHTGNLSDNKSQELYIRNLSTKNNCVTDINKPEIYTDYTKNCSPTLCHSTTAGFTYDSIASKGTYTKTISVPLSASEQTMKIQNQCSNKPDPTANINTGKHGACITRLAFTTSA